MPLTSPCRSSACILLHSCSYFSCCKRTGHPFNFPINHGKLTVEFQKGLFRVLPHSTQQGLLPGKHSENCIVKLNPPSIAYMSLLFADGSQSYPQKRQIFLLASPNTTLVFSRDNMTNLCCSIRRSLASSAALLSSFTGAGIRNMYRSKVLPTLRV